MHLLMKGTRLFEGLIKSLFHQYNYINALCVKLHLQGNIGSN